MSFTDAISAGFQRYFDFQGRASRPEFWWFLVFLCLLGIGTAILDLALGYGGDIGPTNTISTLATIVPSLSVGARRLHDIGRSGWWQLIVLVPLVGIILLIYWWCQPASSA
jgi:uncharacterized membrane protein YhaH (DUF805 family)